MRSVTSNGSLIIKEFDTYTKSEIAYLHRFERQRGTLLHLELIAHAVHGCRRFPRCHHKKRDIARLTSAMSRVEVRLRMLSWPS